MARETVTIYRDDLDGTKISEGRGGPHTFALDGTEYAIDLSDKNLAKLNKALEPFIDAGSRVRGTRARKRSARGTNAAEIRAWARDNGYEVPDRGRIPAEIREAWESVK